MAAKAEVKIGAKDLTGPGIQSAKKKIGLLTNAVKSYWAEIAVAYMAMRKVYKIVKDLTEAWGKQETAIIELNNALINTDIYTPRVSHEIQQLASELQSMTTYGDEATLSATAMLQSLAGLNSEGLKNTIPLIQDLAAGMGMDLNMAASLVGKTLGSTTNALTRYGIVVDMSGTKAERLVEVQKQITEKFGGRSASLADSYTGKVKQLGNAFGDLKEAMGHVIANRMEPAIPLMTEITEKLTDWINAKIKLKEAYEIVGQEMEKFNATTKISILVAEQEIASAKIRRANLKLFLPIYGKRRQALKDEIAETRKEMRARAALIDNMELALQARQDLIDKETEAVLKIKEDEEAVKKVIESTDEWTNTIIYTGDALRDYIEMCDSARESQKWLNEENEKAIEIIENYAGPAARLNDQIHETDNAIFAASQSTNIYSEAMRRLEDRARLMKQPLAEMSDPMNELTEKIREAEDQLRNTEQFVREHWAPTWELMGNAALSAEEKVKEAFKGIFVDVLKMLSRYLFELGTAHLIPGLMFNPAAGIGYLTASAAASMAAGFIQSLGQGGIVTQPTLALVGESGPEAVVPLSKGGIGPTIIVHVHGSVKTEKDIAVAIAEEMQRQGYIA